MESVGAAVAPTLKDQALQKKLISVIRSNTIPGDTPSFARTSAGTVFAPKSRNLSSASEQILAKM